MKPFYNAHATVKDPYQVSPSSSGIAIPATDAKVDGYQPIRTPPLSTPMMDGHGSAGASGKGTNSSGKQASLRASPLHANISLESTLSVRAKLSEGKGAKSAGIGPSTNAFNIAIQDDDHDLDETNTGLDGMDALTGME